MVWFIVAWNRAQECMEQYTKDTETVAKFLRDEGEKFACEKEWLKTPEMKGKRTYILYLNTFELIARHLATQRAFSVPPYIMDAIDTVIKLRIECNRIHEELGVTNTLENGKHEYPVRVFQDIGKILLPKARGLVASSAKMQRLPSKR